MTRAEVDVGSLVEKDRVHSHVYTSDAIFEAELERIFHKTWVYVGHASEVANIGDYCTRWIGRQSVIMTRRSSEDVTVYMNRCRHRGTALCIEASGHARFFRCPYHGWTYGIDGALVGVPFPSRYGAEFDKAEFGLTEAPGVASYRGFVFARLTAEGRSLHEHLGPAAGAIDMLVDAAPDREIDVQSGVHTHAFEGNWKFVGMDGYHINFVHRSAIELEKRQNPDSAFVDLFTDQSPNRTVDFGNGHVRLDTAPSRSEEFGQLLHGESDEESEAEYLSALISRDGRERAEEVYLLSRDPHLAIFPNLQILGVHIRVIRPIAPDRTEVAIYPTILKGAPDIVNEARIRANEWSYGSAGLFQPDDSEIFERIQLGLQCSVDPWLYLGRGLGAEEVDDRGVLSGNITDEVTQRGQMRAWLELMTRDHDE